MFVFKPCEKRFQELLLYMEKHSSFDGGDQGLLNEFFKNWNRLSFTYNTSASTVYSYLPAFKRYEKSVKILHFLGSIKPWNINFNEESHKVSFVPFQYQHTSKYLDKWWNLFYQDVLPLLKKKVSVQDQKMQHECTSMEDTRLLHKPQQHEPCMLNWLNGDVDYLGIDAFDNILKHIESTLSQRQ